MAELHLSAARAHVGWSFVRNRPHRGTCLVKSHSRRVEAQRKCASDECDSADPGEPRPSSLRFQERRCGPKCAPSQPRLGWFSGEL